tara:strand:+ start:348 stop:668 length:321 start_codon:yes stop_codon:yes gene_type:complete
LDCRPIADQRKQLQATSPDLCESVLEGTVQRFNRALCIDTDIDDRHHNPCCVTEFLPQEFIDIIAVRSGRLIVGATKRLENGTAQPPILRIHAYPKRAMRKAMATE